MKKIFIICLIVFSCNTNKTAQPVASIKTVEYTEFSNEKGPTVIIDIKVTDSSIIKKLESKQLRGFRIYSIKEKDRNYFFYEVWKAPIKKGNIFSFLIRTSYFSQNISDKEKRIWNKDNITKALSGDVGLIFEKDTIHVKPAQDRKIVIQMLKN